MRVKVRGNPNAPRSVYPTYLPLNLWYYTIRWLITSGAWNSRELCIIIRVVDIIGVYRAWVLPHYGVIFMGVAWGARTHVSVVGK